MNISAYRTLEFWWFPSLTRFNFAEGCGDGSRAIKFGVFCWAFTVSW